MNWKSIGIVLSMLILAIGLYIVLPSLASTVLLDNDIEIEGIPTNKDTTNIIVVHGIGDHCIGYADTLITSFIRGYAEDSKLNLQRISDEYVQYSINEYTKKIESNKITGKKYLPLIYPPRIGSCNIDRENKEVIKVLKELGDKVVDGHKYLDSDELDRVSKYGAYVDSQEKMCEFMHLSKTKKGDVKTDCFELYVNKNYIDKDPDYPDKAQYITGFIRKITINTSSLNTINILEVTWSPATRWIKSALHAPEILNGKNTLAAINKIVKSEIINSAIADAVAYLSDSGILINFDLLQAFCLALGESDNADVSIDQADNKFACDKSNLKAIDRVNYAEKNDTILISHSLGTRILFDTLGYMSFVNLNDGVDGQKQPDLFDIMYEKFGKIHAAVPDHYTEQSTSVNKSFSDLLDLSIPVFIDSIHSMFVFTNQIPLLAANISSPLKPNHLVESSINKIDFGKGFSNILKLRTNPKPLQIVSFHDPDDMLSYNLSCWFRTSVLKHNEDVKDAIDKVAITRSKNNNTEEGYERRKIWKVMFNSCSLDENDKYFRKNEDILEHLWATQKRFELKDASVRLSGGKMLGLLADPHDVHSNYFTDAEVHSWLINGH